MKIIRILLIAMIMVIGMLKMITTMIMILSMQMTIVMIMKVTITGFLLTIISSIRHVCLSANIFNTKQTARNIVAHRWMK